MFVDFTAVKILKEGDSKINRTFTIIGTPQYMAPEMFTGKGYTLNADAWAIGQDTIGFI